MSPGTWKSRIVCSAAQETSEKGTISPKRLTDRGEAKEKPWSEKSGHLSDVPSWRKKSLQR